MNRAAFAISVATAVACVAPRAASAQWIHATITEKGTNGAGEMIMKAAVDKGGVLYIRCNYEQYGTYFDYQSSRLAIGSSTRIVPVEIMFDSIAPLSGVTWRHEAGRSFVTVSTGLAALLDKARQSRVIQLTTTDSTGQKIRNEFNLAGLSDGLGRLTCM